MKLLFVAPPFAGHLNRLVRLAETARADGHQVTFVTGHAKLDALTARGFPALAPPFLPPGALEAIADGHGRTDRRPWNAWAQIRDYVALLPALTDDLTRIIERTGTEILVADSVAIMAGPAAARTGVPWITTLASPLCLEQRRGTPGFLGGLAPPRGPLGRARDAAGRRATLLVKSAGFAVLRPRLGTLFPALRRANGSETIYSPQAILGLGMTELEFPRDWPAAFEMIGPLHDDLEGAPPVPLPPAARRVLVTLGTHLRWARAKWEREVTLLAADLPDWHFTLTRGEARGGAGAWLAPNVHAVPWLSYAREVPRHDIVIHQGGTGIAYAAIVAGRPSLVVPHDYDQPDYAARIAHHGLGLRARSLRGAAPLLRQLAQEDWPALPLFAAAARRYDPDARFLAALDRVARG